MPFFSGLLRLGSLAMLALAPALLAAEPEPDRTWADPSPAARYWLDTSGSSSLEAARAAFAGGQGRALNPGQVMPLARNRAVWFQLDLSPVRAPVRAVLTLPIPGLDRVELHRPDGGGGWHKQTTGDSVPVAQWPIRYLHPAFIFTVHPSEPRSSTYLKVQHGHPVAVNWELRDASGFDESSKMWHLLLGGYLGVIALMIVLSVAHTVFWRDSIHVYYGVHVILLGLMVLSLSGLGGEYLWPDSPWWNDIASVVLPAAALGWLGLFMRELVAERRERLLSRMLIGQAAISFLIAIGYLQFGRNPLFFVQNAIALPSLALLLGAAVWYSLRRPQVGLWVLAGLAVLTVGAIFPVLRNLGLTSDALSTQYALQIGGALEMPLVLVGLYFRGRERRDNKVRIDALARTDPLTGVGSHRVLIDQLERMLERRRSNRFLGAVLRVRVRNLRAITDQYGRDAADAAVVRAAECVALASREGDTVAREQGGDLVLLLEGRILREQASASGRDIIARGLKFSGWLPPGVTLALDVAGAVAPLPEGNAQLLLGTLGQVLQDIADDTSGRALRILKTVDATQPAPLEPDEVPDRRPRQRGAALTRQ